MDPTSAFLRDLYTENCNFGNESDPLYSWCKSVLANSTDVPYETSGNNTENQRRAEELQEYGVIIGIFQFSFSLILMMLTATMTSLKRRGFYIPKWLYDQFTTTIAVNFLEARNDRLTIAAAFAVTASNVANALLSIEFQSTSDTLTATFIRIIMALIVCIMFRPLFTCYSANTYFNLVMGLLYLLTYLALKLHLSILIINLNCELEPYDPNIGGITELVIIIVFGAIVLYGYSKKIYFKITQQHSETETLRKQRMYLKSLLTTKPVNKPYRHILRTGSISGESIAILNPQNPECWESCTNRFYKMNTKGFQFSLSILVSVTVGFIILTYIMSKVLSSIVMLDSVIGNLFQLDWIKEWKNIKIPKIGQIFRLIIKSDNMETTITLYNFLYDQYNIIFGTLYASFAITYVLFIFVIIHMLKSYKENILTLQKHQVPIHMLELKDSNVSLVINAVQYCGFQVAYFVVGVICQIIVLTLVILVVCEGLILPLKYSLWSIKELLATMMPILITLVLTRVIQRVLVKFSYLQDRGKVLGLKNRNGFYNMMYFMFFYNILMGLFRGFMRIVGSIVFTMTFLARLDRSIFPKTFESMDSGYRSYSCLLKMEMLQNNIIVTSAVSMFADNNNWNGSQNKLTNVLSPSTKLHHDANCLLARNRWFLSYTLIRNPQLIQERRPMPFKKEANVTEEGIMKQLLRDIIFPILNLDVFIKL